MAIPREQALQRVNQIREQLQSESLFRRKLIDEYEDLREQNADRHTLTQKHLEILGSIDRMNELRIELVTLHREMRIEGGGDA